MSFSFGFYNSIEHDRLYDAIQVSKIFDGIIRDGVYATIGDAFIVQAGDEPNLVVIGPGRAWFNHTWNENDGYLDFVLDPPETVIDRIDAIVIDVDSRTSVRTNRILVLKGTPSSTPEKPSLIREIEHNQYPLAYILRKAAAETIQPADIENAVGTSECPFVTGVLETIDTDLLLLQWRDAWTQFIEECTTHINEWEDEARTEVTNFVTEFERQCNEYLTGLEQRCDEIVTNTETWETEQKEDFKKFYDEFKQTSEAYEQEVTDWVDTLKQIIAKEDLAQLIDDMERLKVEFTDIITKLEQDMKRVKEVVAGFQSKVTTFSEDGNTITETLDDGSKIVTTFLENGNIETLMTSAEGVTILTKLTEFREDGSIVETVSRTEGGTTT